MSRHRKKSRMHKNPSALLSFVIVAISGFLLPLFSFQIFGQNFSDKSQIMFNFVISLFSGQINFAKDYMMILSAMVLLYLVILLTYLVNGLGLIYNRNSRYASYLSLIYFFLGIISVALANREAAIGFLGNTLGEVNLGWGIIIPALVGLGYLIFSRQINRAIKF